MIRTSSRNPRFPAAVAASMAAAVLFMLPGAPVSAQQGHGSHGAHGAHSAAPAGKAAASASTREYEAVNERMHRAMAIPFTGDADVDFVRGMIPHHQGAVEMARVVLKHGKDAETRKLALAIIKSQEAEIAWMQAWLKKRGK